MSQPIIVVVGVKDDKPPVLLVAYLAALKKVGCIVAFDETIESKDIKILVIGLDPKKHEMPKELFHFLLKIQKDFQILYNENAQSEEHKKLLAQSGFKPEIKKQIITEEKRIIRG